MTTSHSQSYRLPAIIFHWLSAVVVFGLFGVGVWMVDLNYYSEWYRTAPHWHKSIGLLLALLTIARLVYKLSSKPLPGLGKPVENIAAKWAHALLYILLFSLFLSGYLISTADGRGIDIFTWVTVPSLGNLFDSQEDIAGDVHEYLAYSLMVLVALHTIAALKHHFVNRDATLVRMLSPQRSKQTKSEN